MSLTSPSPEDIRQCLEPALHQLRNGGMVILRDADDREGEGDLAFAARYATPELVNHCLTIGRGLLCLALTPEDASRLGVTRLPSNGRDRLGTPFGSPISLADGGSGVSVAARASTLRSAGDPTFGAKRFVIPGHVATLLADPGGVLRRPGHTEAVVEILRLAGIGGPGVLCEILDDRGEVARRAELESTGRDHGFPLVDIDDLVTLATSEIGCSR